MNKNLPERCVDPVMKCCQYCDYGYIIYPQWVETLEDTFNCCFECGCTLGYDKGRPEDEPTPEELKKFDEEIERILLRRSNNA